MGWDPGSQAKPGPWVTTLGGTLGLVTEAETLDRNRHTPRAPAHWLRPFPGPKIAKWLGVAMAKLLGGFAMPGRALKF